MDTYGGWGAHGGGAFSGKDYTKVDRSAAYAARWVAKSLVKAGLCRRVLVQVGVAGAAPARRFARLLVIPPSPFHLLQVAYAIGVAHPLSVSIFHYGTSRKTEQELLDIVAKNFDLRPGVIVRYSGDIHPLFFTHFWILIGVLVIRQYWFLTVFASH